MKASGGMPLNRSTTIQLAQHNWPKEAISTTNAPHATKLRHPPGAEDDGADGKLGDAGTPPPGGPAETLTASFMPPMQCPGIWQMNQYALASASRTLSYPVP